MRCFPLSSITSYTASSPRAPIRAPEVSIVEIYNERAPGGAGRARAPFFRSSRLVGAVGRAALGRLREVEGKSIGMRSCFSQVLQKEVGLLSNLLHAKHLDMEHGCSSCCLSHYYNI